MYASSSANRAHAIVTSDVFVVFLYPKQLNLEAVRESCSLFLTSNAAAGVRLSHGLCIVVSPTARSARSQDGGEHAHIKILEYYACNKREETSF